MGELLATVDDIAEDIQSDLTRVSQQAVLDAGLEITDTVDVKTQPSVEAGGSVSPDIVLSEAARLVSVLTRPTPLAQIATQLRATFGEEIVSNWLGHGTFKNFLVSAVPDIEIVPKGPSYIIPPGVKPDDTWPHSLR